MATSNASRSLQGQIAVVTGASGGIGSAIAAELSRLGAFVWLVGRRREGLESIGLDPTRSSVFVADLTNDEDVASLVKATQEPGGGPDIFVYSAGEYSGGGVRSTTPEALDLMYRANVRSPLLMFQSFLPALIARRGQIVVVNSTQSLSPTSRVGPFAATQHALRVLSESLRDEVNDSGVRVLTIFPGRTATPRMQRICKIEGRPYDPALMVQPEDIASVIGHAIGLPRSAELTNFTIRPMLKSY